MRLCRANMLSANLACRCGSLASRPMPLSMTPRSFVPSTKRGLWTLARLQLDFSQGEKAQIDATLEEISSPYSDFGYLTRGGAKVAMLAGSSDLANGVVEYDLAAGIFTALHSSAPTIPESGYLSGPQVIEFPTEGGKTAFAFFYAPTNKDFENVTGKPPLLVKCHGGPTGAASSNFVFVHPVLDIAGLCRS